MSDTQELLARAVELISGEERSGQQDLADAVEEAINSGSHLLGQAPTGSGKSLAYLAPVIACIAKGKRVVIATATISLQDQLWRKDIPLIKSVANGAVNAAILKGRGQYLCRVKLEAALGGTALFDERPGTTLADDLETLEEFARTSNTGDLAEVEAVAGEIAEQSRRAVSCPASECPGGAECHRARDCFALAAGVVAQDADLIVVNHALYFTHIASGGSLLPEHDVVIFDEAHGLADTATGVLGAEVSPRSIQSLASQLRKANASKDSCKEISRYAVSLEVALDGLEGRVAATRLFGDILVGLDARIATAAASVERSSAGTEGALALKTATSCREVLTRLVNPRSGDVVWVERGTALNLAPVDLGELLADRLFDEHSVILVSATLGTGERFEPLAARLGLDPGAESGHTAYQVLRVDSPFDHQSQAVLYVPSEMPVPNSSQWPDEVNLEIAELLGASGGRALILCTSVASVKRIAEFLRASCDHPILEQGQGSKQVLVDRFIAEETSCLVATRGFWVGLDVPGVACVLVVIDKIPFPRRDEPIVEARREMAGANGFRGVDLPDAALALAQGAGRLIRTKTDRGVVAVLDSRLATSNYRGTLLSALPPMRRTIDRAEACEFLRDAVVRTV